MAESCVANNVGLIQFAVTVIVLHSWESMYSKQREYAILLVTSDFIRVTNFIYPEMVIRFLADESRGKRENKGNEKYTDTPRCNEIRFERISFSKNQLEKIRPSNGLRY